MATPKEGAGHHGPVLLVLLPPNPDFAVLAGLFDISVLDIFVTLVSIQLLF